jgi:glycosyltransferase involved in cell wall biosynthesis
VTSVGHRLADQAAPARAQTAAGAVSARLLYVCNNPSFFASYRGTAACAALAAGYDVHVATPAGEGVEEIVRRGLVHHAIPLVRRSMNPARELRTVCALRRLYAQLRPDVIEHMTIKPVLYGSVAARGLCADAVINWLAGLGFLFADRGWKSRMLQAATIATYRVALDLPGSKVVFENYDSRDAFVGAGTIPRDRTLVIDGAGVPMDKYVPTPLPAGTPVVMFAGRMLWDKGVHDFISAVELLRARGVDARFVLVGGPDPGNPSSIDPRQLEAWNASGLVEWWGQRDAMAEAYRACSVFCFPTAYAEGVPRVLIEAAASCRPIVTTDTPGCREVVRHRKNGLLVPPRSPAAVASAIATLLADEALRREMGRRGRELVADRFSVQTVVATTIALYDAVRGRVGEGTPLRAQAGSASAQYL